MRPRSSEARARGGASPGASPGGRAGASSEDLAGELRAAEARLADVGAALARAQRAAAEVLSAGDQAQAARAQELAALEEAAAARFSRRDRRKDTSSELIRAQDRLAAVEEAGASALYLQWRGVFEGHLRAGGRLEDFPLDDFLRDCCGVAPMADLEAPAGRAAALRSQRASLEDRLARIRAGARQLRGELADARGEVAALRGAAREQAGINDAWLADSLRGGGTSDGPVGRQLVSRLNLERAELEAEMLRWEGRTAAAAHVARDRRAETAELRAVLEPYRRRGDAAEEAAGARVARRDAARRRLDERAEELRQLPQLRREQAAARQLGQDEAALHRQAMACLEESLQEQAAAQGGEAELARLQEALRERFREAAALAASQRRGEARVQESAAAVLELQRLHDQLCKERDWTQRLLASAGAAEGGSPRLRARLGLPERGSLLAAPGEAWAPQAAGAPAPAPAPARGTSNLSAGAVVRGPPTALHARAAREGPPGSPPGAPSSPVVVRSPAGAAARAAGRAARGVL